MAVPFYRYSFESAQDEDRINEYRESENENMRCRNYIEDSETGIYATAYKDYVVDGDHSYAKGLVTEFGMERVMYVLANTVKSLSHDGRIRQEIKDWAEKFNFGFREERFDRNCIINQLNPGVIDILANNVLEEYKGLKLFDTSHCIEGELGDITDKVIVLSPKCLKEEYWSPENQLWLATGGFGCEPNKIGRAVYATCLFDGEETRWDRHNVIGVIKPELMPEWAEYNLDKIKGKINKETDTYDKNENENVMKM